MGRWSAKFLCAASAMLAIGTAAMAGDNGPVMRAPAKDSTQTLMGKGSPASAAASNDSELTWYHAYGRGYRNGYYAGFYGGLGGYYAGYPYVAPYYPPVVSYYSPYYYSTPVYVPPAVGFYGRFGRVAIGIGINGNGSDVAAPPQQLNQPAPTAPATPSNLNRYDGGPALPVPLPKLDGGTSNYQATPTVPADAGLPVSLNKNPPKSAKPYAYKGYGEK